MPRKRQPARQQSLTDVLDADIRALDLAPVHLVLAISQGWSAARIQRAELEYRLFLQLVRNEPRRAQVPSVAGDQFWHAHLQCTAHYVETCQRIFGQLLCHYPFAGALGAQDARRQRRRYQESQAKLAEMRGACRSRTTLRQP
jgi:hypothetical protein